MKWSKKIWKTREGRKEISGEGLEARKEEGKKEGWRRRRGMEEWKADISISGIEGGKE